MQTPWRAKSSVQTFRLRRPAPKRVGLCGPSSEANVASLRDVMPETGCESNLPKNPLPWGRKLTGLMLGGTLLGSTVLGGTLLSCAPAEQIEAPLTTQDSDGDGILDVHEGSSDVDGDGLPNYLDGDSDGDEVADRIEAGDDQLQTFPRDSNGDGTPDFLDTDSDGNGVPDAQEVGLDAQNPLDSDGNGLADFTDADNDGDLIADVIEIGAQIPFDTDSDGLADYYDTDSDGDLILDRDEAGDIRVGEPPVDTDQDERADYRDLDSDGDGLPDRDESGDKDPATAPEDVDGDGIGNFADLDSDGDSLKDAEETASDTDPYRYDTDGDGASDGVERMAGSEPADVHSIPSVRWLNVPQRGLVSEDFTFTAVVSLADIVFVLDNTGSMADNIDALADDFSKIVARLSNDIPSSSFGVATYQYYHGIVATPGQKPHKVEQQLTSSVVAVQETLDALVAGGSSGAALESLYQSLTGVGFDENCNRSYDAAADVPPFISSEVDVFGGAASGVYDELDASTGLGGGLGFRPSALPVLVYAADIVPLDPDAGDNAPQACTAPSTSHPAGSSDVILAARERGARIIGIDVDNQADVREHMVYLAEETGSVYDKEGTGFADDPLVFSMVPGTDIATAIANGIASMVDTGEFGSVSVAAEDDASGFVEVSNPASVSHVQPGETVSFEIQFRGAVPAVADDQIFMLELALLGDGSTRLAVQPVIIVVPGERQEPAQ